MNTKIIKLDLNRILYDKIIAKQGDTKSRFLLFQLLDGSIPFYLTNRSVRAYMVKPDGKEIFNDLIINNYSLGYCTLELTNQVLAVPGTVKIELMVTEEDRKLTSSVFELEVIKSINSEKSIVSTNEFTALLNGLSSLSEYDNYKNEIAAARDGESNLLTKVKKIDEQLDTIAQYQFEENIDSSNFKKGNKIDLEQLRFYQGINLAKFFQKLRLNENVKITCLGDSLTYGQQTNGTREPDTTICPDGTTHTSKRATTTYPEALQTFLQETFQGTITIENRGYSGDWTKRSYQRWNKKHNGTLSIIMLGTNDALGDHVPTEQQTLHQYIYWYEQIIIRELIWGSAVVLIKSPRDRGNGNIKLDTYRKAVDLLGQKYNLPVLDANEFTNNVQYFIYSDTIHFEERGYKVLGSKVATAISSMCNKDDYLVKSGSIILPRAERIITGNSTITNDINAPTPYENNSTGGIVANVLETEAIYIPVYSDVDALNFNLIGTQTGTCKVEVVYLVQYADMSLMDGRWDNIPNTITYSENILNENSISICLPAKGWHMIKITCLTGMLTYYALKFFNKPIDKTGSYVTKTHPVYSSTPGEVAYSEINIIDIIHNLGIVNNVGEYWKNPSLRLTITNYEQSVISYIVPIGAINGSNSGWKSFKPVEIARQNVIDSPTNERRLKWVSFNKATNCIKLDWEGDLTKLSSISFTVA